MSAWSGPARPLRAAPDVPNVVSGTVTPLRPTKPETVRFTVRLSTEAVTNLDDLDDRFECYVANPSYTAKHVRTRTLTMSRAQHEQMIEEARMAGLTLNGFIERLLVDHELGEGAFDPNGRFKVPGGTWGPVDPDPGHSPGMPPFVPKTWTTTTSSPNSNPIWGPRGPVIATNPFPVAPPD